MRDCSNNSMFNRLPHNSGFGGFNPFNEEFPLVGEMSYEKPV